MNKMRISLFEILQCVSDAVDLVSPEVSNHHQQTAFLAYRIAQQMKLPEETQRSVLMAGIIHDIGALSSDERLSLIEDEPVTMNSHGFRGARLLKEFEPFGAISDIVRFHHVPWMNGQGRRFMGMDVPIESHIIHLADRTSVLLKNVPNALGQVPGILESIKARNGNIFAPEIVDALQELAPREYVWLELLHKAPVDSMPDTLLPEKRLLNINEVQSISKMLSHIIDFRSRFTATHSAGVASTAAMLAEYAGFSQDECRLMLIAGYLHDLGKLAIDSAILEKPGKLDPAEFNAIRAHTFFTYQLLSHIQGFETINRWASFHHEKLNGTGYPFHLKAASIPAGSRIMAVADVFTAITEPRPYRQGMNRDQTISTLRGMVKSGALCGRVVASLLDHFSLMTSLCLERQLEAAEYYDAFSRGEEEELKNGTSD